MTDQDTEQPREDDRNDELDGTPVLAGGGEEQLVLEEAEGQRERRQRRRRDAARDRERR